MADSEASQEATEAALSDGSYQANKNCCATPHAGAGAPPGPAERALCTVSAEQQGVSTGSSLQSCGEGTLSPDPPLNSSPMQRLQQP